MRATCHHFLGLVVLLAPGLARAAEPPPPTIRVVFLRPSDVAEPPGAAERLALMAEAAERFLLDGMTRRD